MAMPKYTNHQMYTAAAATTDSLLTVHRYQTTAAATQGILKLLRRHATASSIHGSSLILVVFKSPLGGACGVRGGTTLKRSPDPHTPLPPPGPPLCFSPLACPGQPLPRTTPQGLTVHSFRVKLNLSSLFSST